jgi:hypothetical protein
MGSAIKQTTAADYDPAFDLPDVQQDIEKIAGHGVKAINWGWFQQGYDHELNDAPAKASHEGYVAHHNAPEYFGYVANNPLASAHLHGLSEFFQAIARRQLPASGVFYVRGGYGNLRGWKPQDPNPKLAQVYWGNDDHPGYSDTQISEGPSGRGDQRHRRKSVLERERHRHHLRRVGRPLRSRPAAHPLPRCSRPSSRTGAAHSRHSHLSVRRGARRVARALRAQLDHQIRR